MDLILCRLRNSFYHVSLSAFVSLTFSLSLSFIASHMFNIGPEIDEILKKSK